MKLRLLPFILIGLTLVHVGQTQERAAGSSVDVQMSWSALSTMVQAVDTKTTAVNSRVDQIVVCSKKGMVYAPATAGIDTDGCLNPKNTVNTTDYDKVVACNDQGLVFDKSANACIRPSVVAPNCSASYVSAQQGNRGWQNVDSVSPLMSQGYQCVRVEYDSGSTGSSRNQEYEITTYACMKVTCS